MTHKPTAAELPAEYLATLRTYAARNGRNWKAALLLDWSRASYPSMPDPQFRSISREGSMLQSMRNSYGPEWLAGFKLPKAEG